MPVSVKRVDPVGDDRRVAVAQRAEQVAVGHEAHALVPRVVARREVRVDVEPSGSWRLTPERISFFTNFGRRRLSWKKACVTSTFFQRTIGYASFCGRRLRSDVGDRVAGRERETT